MIGDLEFRPIRSDDVSVESMKEIGKMHLEYVRYSRDTMLSVPQVFEVIRESVSAPNLPFQFWIAKDGEKFSGFALTQFKAGPRGLEFDLSQVYIAPGYRTFETQKMGIDRFEDFARSKGCYLMTTSSMRDPVGAYLRWMGRVGFRKACVVVQKDLRREKYGS